MQAIGGGAAPEENSRPGILGAVAVHPGRDGQDIGIQIDGRQRDVGAGAVEAGGVAGIGRGPGLAEDDVVVETVEAVHGILGVGAGGFIQFPLGHGRRREREVAGDSDIVEGGGVELIIIATGDGEANVNDGGQAQRVGILEAPVGAIGGGVAGNGVATAHEAHPERRAGRLGNNRGAAAATTAGGCLIAVVFVGFAIQFQPVGGQSGGIVAVFKDRALRAAIESHQGTGDIAAKAVTNHDAGERIGTGVLIGEYARGNGDITGDGLVRKLKLVIVATDAIARTNEGEGAGVGAGGTAALDRAHISGLPGGGGSHGGERRREDRLGGITQARRIGAHNPVVILTQRRDTAIRVIGRAAGKYGERGEVGAVGGTLDDIAGFREADGVPAKGHLAGRNRGECKRPDRRQRRTRDGQ